MGTLRHDALRKDQRFIQGKALIQEALAEQRQGLEAISPPDPLLRSDYEALLDQAKKMRSAPLLFPYIGSGFGSGPFVELLDGSVKLDLINGIGVHYSHGAPEMTECLLDAACQDLVMQGNLQQNREPILLMDELTKASGFPHCFLTTSGAMAVENGLKMAFQKHAPKKRVLAFENGFHGRTCTLANITDRPQYRVGLPPNVEVDYLPFYPGNALDALKMRLKQHDYAAFLFEPIQGEGGVNSAPGEFFAPLFELLRSHDIAIIADEVQTFGRTEKLIASSALGLSEFVDILAIGKLGTVCATLFTKDYTPKIGLISQTFTSSTAAIFAARRVLQSLLQGHFGPEGKNVRLHSYLERGLKQFEPKISGPFGVGLMCAFTLGKGEEQETIHFVQRAFDKGVMLFVAGQNPKRVRLLLPPCLEEKHLDIALTVIGQTLDEVTS